MTGQLTVAAGNLLDFETAQSHLITVRVTDSSLTSFEQGFTISLTNAVENQTRSLTQGNDNFVAPSADNWTISGNNGNDAITTLGGIDRITGGAGDDTISTGEGNDTIVFSGTNGGFDTVDGGAGFDTILATARNTVIGLKSVAGIEAVSAGALTGVYIQGSAGNDTFDFSGATLTNIASIRGGAGNDTILGSSGADIIMGEAGSDTLTGGGGADRFVFSLIAEIGFGPSADRIMDFIQGLDKIDLSAIDANTLVRKDQAFSFIGNQAFSNVAGQLRVEIDGSSDGHLYGDVNGDSIADFEIVLAGLGSQPPLQSSDFFP